VSNRSRVFTLKQKLVTSFSTVSTTFSSAHDGIASPRDRQDAIRFSSVGAPTLVLLLMGGGLGSLLAFVISNCFVLGFVLLMCVGALVLSRAGLTFPERSSRRTRGPE